MTTDTTRQRKGTEMKPLLMIAAIALAGCDFMQDEKACYEKLASDFDSYAETARSLGHMDSAIQARSSAVDIVVIWSDDDRNACDYVSAGPYLERK